MEDSFKSRVEKVFGSLQHSTEPSPVVPSPWFLTDCPVERKDWKKGRDDDVSNSRTANRDDFPCSSAFDCSNSKLPSRCRMEFESEGENGDLDAENHTGHADWDVWSSIGMDRTLDNEEEEDEYDRVAEGKEEADCVDSFLVKDPRANHSAANVRLQEDWAEGQQTNPETSAKFPKDQFLPPERELRPILKRKDVDSSPKSNKRVKFDATCKFSPVDYTPGAYYGAIFTSTSNDLPDYLCNPSRYTRYSFDSSEEMNERSNSEAYLSFLSTLKGSRGDEVEDCSEDSPKSVTFIPRKKASSKEDDTVHSTDYGVHSKQGSISGVKFSEDCVQNDDTVMEDNEEVIVADSGARKSSRKYRNKSCYDD